MFGQTRSGKGCRIGAPGRIGVVGIEDRRQDGIVDHHPPAALLGRGLGLGDDGGGPLADEAHRVVEHPGIGGIVRVEFVARRREARLRRVG